MKRVKTKRLKKQKNNKLNIKKVSINKILVLIFLVSLVCVIIHPIELIKTNLFKPVSEAAGGTATATKPRYAQSETIVNTYVDGSGKEYDIKFKQNLPEETILSYEQIIQHKAEVETTDSSNYIEQKDLFIAEMKSIPNLNYELRYRKQYPSKTNLSNDIKAIASEDSTITEDEAEPRLKALWNILKVKGLLQHDKINGHNTTYNLYYKNISNEERIFRTDNGFFDVGEIYARTRTLALYKRSVNLLTVENDGITPAEAYIMASTRNQSTSLDIDKNQQAFWMINDYVANIEEIPNIYKGINPEANIVGRNVTEEAKKLKEHTEKMKDFKESHIVDNLETEIYDNMLDVYDTTANANYYESGMAGLVGYDENAKEYLVGPFSIDYIRTIYVPIDGGQNENQNKEGIIIFNSIVDADVYGLNANGDEVKLDDWEFLYTDVEYDLKAEKATRIAETNAIKNGDITPTIYPYPNENFYIRFKDPNIQAITDLEFKTSGLTAEAEVYLYEGQTYNVNWVGASEGGKSFLQMTPSWTEIKAQNLKGTSVADLYQIKSARIVTEEKTIRLSVGKSHDLRELIKKHENEPAAILEHCIPITMELGGFVWYDGHEKEQVQDPNKVFGIREKDEDGEYLEYGMKDIIIKLYNAETGEIVPLYDANTGKWVTEMKTDSNGNYILEYVKLGPKYYIEFLYDGVRYKATTYLNGEDTSENYRDPSQFLNYLDYSHAREVVQERIDFNNQFTEIKNGTTRPSGESVSNEIDPSTGKEVRIPRSYTIEDFSDEYIGGTASIDRYNFSTRTVSTDLKYPLQDSYIITNNDISNVDQNQIYLRDLGIKNIFVLGRLNLAKNQNYIVKTDPFLEITEGEDTTDTETEDKRFLTEATINYTMVDTYLHNINLGLIERDPIDFAVKNDLVETKLTKNNELLDVNVVDFSLRDFNKNSFDIDTRYQPDYFTGEPYSQTIDFNDYKDRYDWYNNTYTIENDQTQLYLTYKMVVRNQANVVNGYITELVNYYDEELYYPVDSNEVWKYYDENINYMHKWEENGKKGYAPQIMPQVTTLTSWAVYNDKDGHKKRDLGQVIWESNSKFGSENNKEISGTGLKAMYTSSLKDIELAPDESIEIYIVYKVRTDENNSVENGYGKYIINDNSDKGKRNIVEINSYKAINIDGTEGGRVDIDSNPGNSEISKIENFVTYEDDTDEALRFQALVDITQTKGNTIVGYVWEDKRVLDPTTNEKRGNGVLDRSLISNYVSEDYINNVKVELIRLEYNPELDIYEEVEFTDKYKQAHANEYTAIYPGTDTPLEGDYSSAVVSWTGPNHNNGNVVRPLRDGQYRFQNLVSGGKYKVRFTYGTEDQLREERIKSKSTIEKLYSGHDYKATTFDKRIDVYEVPNDTKVTFVIDSYEVIKKAKEDIQAQIPIINILKNLHSDLRNANPNVDTQFITFGAESYKDCKENIDSIKDGNITDVRYSAYDAIYAAGQDLVESNYLNKIMVVYNDGVDTKQEDVIARFQDFLKQGITIIGIGYGTESLGIYKAEYTDKTIENKVIVYTLNEYQENHEYIQNDIEEKILDVVIDEYYFEDNVSHAEDYLQNETYYRMKGLEKNKVNVTGRLEVMQYSQKMNAERANDLNVKDMPSFNTNKDSDWSKWIKNLADNTQMTADSYEVSFSGRYIEEKTLNLGLEEIPKRELKVKNQVDSIAVNLASGRKIIDWKSTSQDVQKNVQEIEDELFSIYMDEEIMQGANIEVTYRVDVSNVGEIDNLDSYVYYATTQEKIDWYNRLTGENISLNTPSRKIDKMLLEPEPIKISKIYSYFDNLVFRPEDNNKWSVLNRNIQTDGNNDVEFTDEKDLFQAVISRDNIRAERVVWTEVNDISREVQSGNVLERNEDRIDKYSVVETTSLKDIELYPSSSMKVLEDLNSKEPNRTVSTISTYLVLSKTISAEDVNAQDALSYRNYMEIMETLSNTGRRDYKSAEGNFSGDRNVSGDSNLDEIRMTSEGDIDAAERIIILPPFGDKKIMTGLIIVALTILGIGIIFIKKKVL